MQSGLLAMLLAFVALSCVDSLPAVGFSGCKGRPQLVWSDVDDTMRCAGIIGGNDKQWAPGTIYAGYPQLYLEISRGPSEATNPEGINVLTARPQEISGVKISNESPVIEALIDAAKKSGIEGFGLKEAFYGKLSDMETFNVSKRNDNFAKTKSGHYLDFQKEHPGEYCSIFFGDNGQGDLFAARNLADHTNVDLAATLIHDVRDRTTREDQPGVWLFDTYADAAIIAYREFNLISLAGLSRVANAIAYDPLYNKCLECLNPSGRCSLNPLVKSGGCVALQAGLMRLEEFIRNNSQ
eukprot:Colp12_sorted_trinity150504_noHs@14351